METQESLTKDRRSYFQGKYKERPSGPTMDSANTNVLVVYAISIVTMIVRALVDSHRRTHGRISVAAASLPPTPTAPPPAGRIVSLPIGQRFSDGPLARQTDIPSTKITNTNVNVRSDDNASLDPLDFPPRFLYDSRRASSSSYRSRRCYLFYIKSSVTKATRPDLRHTTQILSCCSTL